MEQNFQTTKIAGLGQDVGVGNPPNAEWSDPTGVTGVGDPAYIGFFSGGQSGDALVVSQFGFDLPDFAVVDGIAATVTASQSGCMGDVSLSAGGSKDVGALNQTYGDSTDLWGETSIPVADINDTAFGISIALEDISGGDGYASISLVEITVYWHVDITATPADVPIRVAYKVYSRDGQYLGELPNVSTPFAFAQDINSAGSTIDIVCGEKAENTTTVAAILDDSDDEILTDDDLPILAETTDLVIAAGDSPDDAMFKNSNRIKVWMYNYWYPNGKLMFSGQVNKVGFNYGGGDSSIKLLVLSDGLDLGNFIARGYPFAYSTDVTQSSQNGYVTVSQGSGSGSATYNRYGQTWRTGGAVTNVGAIVLKLLGKATVTVSVYDGPNGNLIGSVSKVVSKSSATDVQFDFPQLLAANSSDEYFMTVSVQPGQSMRVYKHGTSSTYANGAMYRSTYSGGSGGAVYAEQSGDFYFITKYGTPTTTATYSTDDPVSEMMTGILLDYNARGGYITERNFEATGLSITYTFNQSTIFDALRKILELSPINYYSYIDLGTAEIDILTMSTGADFTVVRGKDVNELDVVLSIEQLKNYMLFSGGEVSPGVNLYRDYQDTESTAFYGTRTESKNDNRVTLSATADAIGNTFIEENSSETQETSLTVPVTSVDTTLFTPGKTVGFRNFGNFIDDMVLQIVRREFNTKFVTLTLGRLPVRMSEEVQRINRGLLNEQTINNPSAPS